MAVTYYFEEKIPRYICLSTDVSGSKVSGISVIGAKVLFTDTGTEWIVKDDLTLGRYNLNVITSGSSSSSSSGSSVSVTNFPTIQITSGCVTNFPSFPSNQVTSGCITNFPTVQTVSGSASEYHLGEIGGNLTYSSLEFTNSSGSGTAYIANDVVSGSLTVVTPYELTNAFRKNGGSGYIVSLGLSTDKSSITPQFRVHFFNSSTAIIAGDNLPYKDLYSDNSKKLKYYDLPSMASSSDTSGSLSRAFDNTIRFPVVAGSATNSLFYALEALTGYQQNATERYFISVIIDNN